MTPGSLFGLLPLLLGILGAQPGPVGTIVTRLVVQDEIILRVPLQPRPLLPNVVWSEHGDARCVPIGAIRQALMSGPAQIDFVMADRSRVRAQLDNDCPALDFYSDFYLQPEDDRLCEGRDSIHSRMGGSCSIRSLKRLVPKVKK